MNTRAQLSFIACLLVSFGSVARAGVYPLEGCNPDGEAYSGELEVREHSPGLLRLGWLFGGRELLWAWAAPFADDLLGAVVVDGDEVLVEVFRVADAGLAGLWSDGLAHGFEEVGEPPEPPAALDLEGNRVYRFTRQAADGFPVTGEVTLSAVPDAAPGIARVRWELAGETAEHIGEALRVEGGLAAVFRTNAGPGLVCLETDGADWSGVWFVTGMEKPLPVEWRRR